MKAMKILIVSRTFYPENTPRAFRATELAKQFSAMGHEVTVITPRKGNEHDEFEKKHRVSIKDLGTPTWKQIKVSGAGVKRLYLRVKARLFNLLFLYPDIQTMFFGEKRFKKRNWAVRFAHFYCSAAPGTLGNGLGQ
jgi:glycogen synthase